MLCTLVTLLHITVSKFPAIPVLPLIILKGYFSVKAIEVSLLKMIISLMQYPRQESLKFQLVDSYGTSCTYLRESICKIVAFSNNTILQTQYDL
jgi:hypothetical protein